MTKFWERFTQSPELRHLKKLTTDFGLMQHSRYATPDPEHGYSIDDNARALIVTLKYYLLYNKKSVLLLAEKYLSYLEKAFIFRQGFHNFASFDRQFTDEIGSTDSLGRTFWALGFAVHSGIEPFYSRARILAQESADLVLNVKSMRSKAFGLIGFYYLNDQEKVKKLADSLVDDYRYHKGRGWHWPGTELTYSNAIFPLSLLFAYFLTKKKKYLDVALKSLDFLLDTCRVDGKPAPIGQAGWYKKGEKKAVFDQQPVDAAKTAITSLYAYLAKDEKEYLKEGRDWFNWFHGNNIKGVNMLTRGTKGVYDGITPYGVNRNQGAESIVMYLMMYLDFARLAKNKNKKKFDHWLW